MLLLFVFLEEIYLKDKYESIFAYVQLYFILNIVMYHGLHRKLYGHYFASTVNKKRLFGDFDFVYTAKFSAMKTSKLQPF